MFKRKKEERLGELLVKKGVISEKQLGEAIEKHQLEGKLIGRALVDLGYVTDHDIVATLVVQYGFPYIQLENYDINVEAVKLVPKQIAVQYKIVPMDIIGNIILVAMENPLNSKAINAVEDATSKTLRCFISTSGSIELKLNEIYK
ncbi:MAG: hypothetical protein HQL29_00475 [Candidatus Omnitrophica bacterium]|nr:hypothetical protein [Candidatus Omnitrophota bacterium]